MSSNPLAQRSGNVWALASALAIMSSAAVALRIEGRSWWCSCGEPRVWIADAWGPHNSQHLSDPYSFSHVLHGVVFWWLLSWSAPRLAVVWRAVAAIGIEAAWEVAENTAWAIERYRTATAAIGYTGDTVLNSLGDTAFCAAGLVVAQRLGWRRSALVFLLTEAVLLVWIRDSLLLNVLMLVYPIDAIRQWQLGH
jgi:hypothetical protein